MDSLVLKTSTSPLLLHFPMAEENARAVTLRQEEVLSAKSKIGKQRTLIELSTLRGNATTATLDKETFQDIADLLLTLRSSPNGLGISAPQVGINKRIFIIEPQRESPLAAAGIPLLIIINPQILRASNSYLPGIEGSLSIPNTLAVVSRPENIIVQYQGITDGQYLQRWSGFLARILLHECDYFEGKSFIDKRQPGTDTFTREDIIKSERLSNMRSKALMEVGSITPCRLL